MILRCACLFLLAALCMMGTTTSVAADRFGVGVKVGTYGFGADFGVSVNDVVSFRVSLQRADLSLTETYDEVEYDGDFTFGGEGVMADIYPFKGQFHITAGLFSNRNRADLSGTVTEPVEIGDNIYTPAEVGTLSGTIEFDSTAPYAGVGWGNTSRGDNRVRFVFDVGLLFQGSGRIDDLTSSTGLVSDEDLATEVATIEDDIKDYDFWPVLNFGIAFRF
jgi:hypothetical protein